MAKLRPAGKVSKKQQAQARKLAGVLPCLIIVIGGVVLVGVLFALMMKG